MPVQTHNFQIIGAVAPAFVAKSNRDQSHDTSGYVQQVQASDAEERSAKQASTPGM